MAYIPHTELTHMNSHGPTAQPQRGRLAVHVMPPHSIIDDDGDDEKSRTSSPDATSELFRSRRDASDLLASGLKRQDGPEFHHSYVPIQLAAPIVPAPLVTDCQVVSPLKSAKCLLFSTTTHRSLQCISWKSALAVVPQLRLFLDLWSGSCAVLVRLPHM